MGRRTRRQAAYDSRAREGCGVVEEVGGSSSKIPKIGDRVMVAAITPDWSSLEKLKWISYAFLAECYQAGSSRTSKDSVFGEYFHVMQTATSHIPEAVSPEEALCALSDMVPTGFRCRALDIQFGTVLVNGIGPVGLMSVAKQT